MLLYASGGRGYLNVTVCLWWVGILECYCMPLVGGILECYCMPLVGGDTCYCLVHSVHA